MEATWKPHEKHGELTERSDLPDSVFAFPKQRKEPMTDASHVRNAIARFDQTIGVSDSDRARAFANIKKAARHYGVDMSETDWHELGKHPSNRPHRSGPQEIGAEGGRDPQRARAPPPLRFVLGRGGGARRGPAALRRHLCRYFLGDRIVHAADRAAERLDPSEDRHRNADCNHGILDGRRARLVVEETFDRGLQVRIPHCFCFCQLAHCLPDA
jgi:uncharacterized protein DUF6582